MITTPITQVAAKAACQLEAAICDRLAGDPETLNLFIVYVGLLDSLCGGTSGGALLVTYDDLVSADLAQAQTALENLECSLTT